MTKQDWIRKLTSRKFWLSLAGFVSMLVIYFTGDNSKGESIAALIMAGASVVGYLIGEGLADSANSSTTSSAVNNDAADATDADADSATDEEATFL